MKYITLLIKPASSQCQMQCSYCFYFDEARERQIPDYGIMTSETAHQLIDCVFDYFLEPADITFLFQGGEPTLAGLSYYEDFIAYVHQKKTPHILHYGLQTNGFDLNEDWAEFFKDHHFLLGISLDGPSAIHNLNRFDRNHQGTHQRVMKTIERCQTYDIPFNIITVLTSHLARRPSDYYQFIKKHHFDHIQIIPCLTLFHGTSPDACTPHDFASFYRQIFYLWKKDLRKGYYVSINLFEELLRLLSGQKAAQCGMMGFCGIQYVIEANGDVYPCDFYCLDAWRIGNVCEDDLQSLTNHPLRRTFLSDQPLLSPLCQSCHYRKFCQGNCKRQSSALYDQHFCGLQKIYQLFDSQYEEILTLVKGTL